MRSTLGVALIAPLLLLAAERADGDELPRDPIDASRAVVKDFADRLRSELEHALQASGPVGALQVCKTVAPAIAAERSQATGWEVARTGLRVRNPANAPDLWEAKVLAAFEDRKATGEDPAAMEHWETTADGDRRRFRYMKAIPTAEMCLACHGREIAPEVRAKLAQLYPSDQARGFEPGDIRGAFTIAQPLPQAE